MKLSVSSDWLILGAAVGVGLVILNAISSGRLVTGTAKAVARAPADIFFGGLEGLIGLPDPRSAESQSKCKKALAEGRDWDASFVCPAAQSFKGWFDKEWF